MLSPYMNSNFGNANKLPESTSESVRQPKKKKKSRNVSVAAASASLSSQQTGGYETGNPHRMGHGLGQSSY